MAVAPDDTCVLRLSPGQQLKLRADSGCTIQCCAGTVWVIREGDPRVIVLTAGQRFTVDRPGYARVRAGEGMKDEWGSDTGITAISLPARLLSPPLPA
jgi:hypothetical protein